jgi:putative PIN family toxin of toxin-antitoxin system
MGALQVIRVVLDTNVLVSGLLFEGSPGKVLDLFKTGPIRLTMSHAILDELLRVLAYPRFRLSEEEIHYLLYVEVLPFVEMVEVRPGPTVIFEDPSDDMFLHCAFAAGAEYLISGDRHLLRLKFHKGIKILTPAEFLPLVIS